MIVLKQTTVGIDSSIQALQKFIYGQLKVIWPVDDLTYDAHGRAYRNQTADGYVPEIFAGVGNDPLQPEYKDAYFDDNLKALSFFGVSESEKYNAGSTTANVFLIFMVKVPDIKPDFLHRADEEIRIDVQKLCSMKRYAFTMTGFDTGIDNVFREYSGWRKTHAIKFRDMHPWHCFRINFSLLYSIKDC